MARTKQTLEKLAIEAGLGVDEALMALWDEGIEAVEQPSDVMPKRLVTRARRTLRLGTRRQLASVDYWCRTLSLDRAGLEALLATLEIVHHGRDKLSKRAINRLTTEVHRRRLQPIGGQELPTNEARAEKSAESVKWEEIGNRHEEMKVLSVEDVCAIHETLVADFARADDPIDPPGFRSEDLLASALHRQTTSIGAILKYPTVEMTGAALLHSLVLNHPFYNGNKRTALVALLVFLEKNGLLLTCNQDALFKCVLRVAQHKLVRNTQAADLSDQEVLEIAKWIKDNSRRAELGNRPVQWRRLWKILARYDCELSLATVGNRMNIARKVHQMHGRSFLRPRRAITRQTQVAYSDDGRDADRSVVIKIRRDLGLDDEHGIDSHQFYEEKQHSVDDFIAKYRKTLRHLSKL